MAEFTKEQLIAEVHYNLEHCFCSEKTKRLMEIALAALTAEPYGYVHQALHEDGVMVGLSTDHEAHSDSTTHVSVYRLPLLEGLK